MAPEVVKRLQGKKRTEALMGAMSQVDMVLEETRKLVVAHYRPPTENSYQVSSYEDMLALLKRTEEALGGFNKRIIDAKAKLLAAKWEY